MSDSWENWECEDNPCQVAPSAERTKQLRERKLIEEADNALTCELFGAPKVVEVKIDAKQPTKKKQAKAPKTIRQM